MQRNNETRENMSTIKDVAKLAGVSPSTVSRVLSGQGPSAASEKTKEKIWEAVRKTGYSVNETARKLRKKPADVTEPEQTIDCILARELDYFIDPFLYALRQRMEEELFKRGYRLRAQFGISDMQRYLSDDSSKRDAAIILGRVDMQNFKVINNNYRHLIYTGLQDLDLGIDSVICSGYDAICTAMDYLVGLGHRKICYLGETKSEQRYDAYIARGKKLGIPNDRRFVVDVSFTPSDSYNGLKKALEGGLDCTAIICANDVSALGVMKLLKEKRISVPNDMSVIGVNDMENTRFLEPMLTTMSVHTAEMGSHVVKLLIDRIKKNHFTPVKLYIPSHLIERESCAPPKST